MTQANTWYNPNAMYQPQEQKLNSGIFTTFVDNETTVQNYPVPTGSMAILIDLNHHKMWFKSVNSNGLPEPIRTFNIKEIPLPINPNVVTREEFDTLNKKIDTLLNAIQNKGEIAK